MPVITIEPNSKTVLNFAYSPSGRIRVWLKASRIVDVYISSPQDAQRITSLEEAAKITDVLIYNRRWEMNEFALLPATWAQSGWTLTIAHGDRINRAIGVHYEVYLL